MDTESAVECEVVEAVCVVAKDEVGHIEEEVSTDTEVVEALLVSTF